MQENYSPYIELLTLSFFLTIISTLLYRFIALKLGIHAEPNNRSSHNKNIATGGGIIISFIFLWSAISFLFYIEKVSPEIFKLDVGIAMGAVAITVVGFIDDILDTQAITKLFIQIMLGMWIIFIFLDNIQSILNMLDGSLHWPFIFLIIFLLVWLINVFNFMDAIDGMALSGTILIALGSGVIINQQGGGSENSHLLFLLATICFGFLLFNFPPASIFMGDAGSLFLGYFFGCIIIKTIFDNDLSIWTWVILLGHFLTETTLTTILRIKLTKKWYRAHRAMAYQNLARLLKSHRKVTLISILHYFFWLYPLAYVCQKYSLWGPLIALFSIIPASIITFKYGPLHSNE